MTVEDGPTELEEFPKTTYRTEIWQSNLRAEEDCNTAVMEMMEAKPSFIKGQRKEGRLEARPLITAAPLPPPPPPKLHLCQATMTNLRRERGRAGRCFERWAK